jgi:D-alanyl-D-alanine carboxypeptidase/D-alanyl-D-alanine-endopeptidase (penicillin-binding protein 4)
VSQRRRRILVAATSILLAATPTALGAPPSLAAKLAETIGGRGLDPARTSALAVDLRTGQVVYRHRDRLALAPASTLKVVVSYAALVRLGPRYRFATEVAGTGSPRGGLWQGDLYFVGGGDPTLRRRDVDALAAQLRALGIRRVSGRVVADETRFDRRRDAPGWPAGFLGPESPPLSALAVDRAAGWPDLGPAEAAGRALHDALVRRGIAVAGAPRTGRAPPDAWPLARHLSAPLVEIVRFLNRDSDNFTAELLLKELGAACGEAGTSEAGAAVVVDVLREARIPRLGLRVVDGSGLSRRDRLSAATLVAVLRAGAGDPAIRDAFLTSLAVAGVSGTLEHRMQRRPARGRVIGKTGTTRISSSLAGIVRKRFAFAVLHWGNPVPTWTARAAQDRFATLLASL